MKTTAKHSISGLFLAVMMAFSWTSIQAQDWQLIGELNDPENLSTPGTMDIKKAWIEQSGALLRLSMQMRESVRLEYPESSDRAGYFWWIDVDQNPATGFFIGGLGADFAVSASISEDHGGVFVDVWSDLPGGGSFPDPVVEDDTVQVIIALQAISTPEEFTWLTDTAEWIDGIHFPGNGASQSTNSTTSPSPSPVARVEIIPAILLLSVNDEPTGSLSVRAWNEDGSRIDFENEMHLIQYEIAGPMGIAEIDSETGLVTAIGTPNSATDVPSASAIVDGVRSINLARVRTTENDLNIIHKEYAGNHISYFAPILIEGIDLEGFIHDHQMVQVSDYSYQAQRYLMGAAPWNGETQFLIVDPSDDIPTVNCGWNGNPMTIGWGITPGEDIGGNCFLDLIDDSKIPRWGIIFHEMGHNFNFSAEDFSDFLDANPGQSWHFGEGLASMGTLWTFWSLENCPTAFGSTTSAGLQIVREQVDNEFRTVIDQYKSEGIPYDDMTPSQLNGLLQELFDDYGPEVWFDLFSLFLPADQSLDCAIDSQATQATLFAAAMSASTGEDLRDRFRNEYRFPIDDDAWPDLLQCAQQRVSARTFDLQAACEAVAVPGDMVYRDGFESD